MISATVRSLSYVKLYKGVVHFSSVNSIKHVRLLYGCRKLDLHYSQSIRSYSASKDFRNTKLITFDVTGTLLTFRKPPFDIYKEFGEKHGIQCERESIMKSFKKQWKEMNSEKPHFGTDWKAWWTEYVIRTFKGANKDGIMDDTNLNKVACLLIDYFRTSDCWMRKDGAEALISALSARMKSDKKFAVGIISNFDPRLHQLLKLFPLENVFSPIILSHEHQISKPSQKIFNLTLEEYEKKFGENIQPCEALHVGDNYELDYVGATTAGWKSCLIQPKFNILEIPESKRTLVPEKNEVYKDLQSFQLFLNAQGIL